MGIEFRLPWRRTKDTKEATGKQEGIVVGSPYTRGKYIKPTFATLMKYALSDPHIGAGIDDLAESSVSLGFVLISKNEASWVQDGIEKLEDYCEENNLDTLNLGIAKDLWATGNSLIEKLEPEGLEFVKRLPIDSAQRIKTDEQGNVIALKQYLNGKTKWWRENPRREEVDIKKLYHLKWNCIDARPIGRGLIHKLATQGVGYTWTDANGTIHTEYRPSWLEIKEETDDMMRKIVHKHVSRHVYDFQGFTDAQATARANEVFNLRAEDDLVTNSPTKDKQEVKITRVQSDTRTRLDAFIKYFFDGTLMGLETPTPKLFLETGFTEASAREATKEKMRKIRAFRRFLKREHERNQFRPALMAPVNTEFGLGWSHKQWQEAKIRLRWERDIDIDKVIEGFRLGGLTRETLQQVFEKKYGIEVKEGTYILPRGKEEMFQTEMHEMLRRLERK